MLMINKILFMGLFINIKHLDLHQKNNLYDKKNDKTLT